MKKSVSSIQRALLTWWDASSREMPWRGVEDPYAVWVSEIMLQQTRVETVGPYYRRFMRLFPTVRRLADAPLERVLKAWEGLGYYSRARNLHAAARKVVADFAGRLPGDVERLRSLPGIGPYTAGAIASIAFGLDEPVLDGNVSRVLCRLVAMEDDPARPATRERLWGLARRFVPSGRAGLFNQAMMDLGATLCVPRRPRCADCPLRRHCRARERGLQDRLPVRRARPPVPHYDIAAGVVRHAGRILIARRREDAMLGGLWELPGGKVEPGETPAQAAAREIREEVGVEAAVGELVATINHAYAHFRITLHVFACRLTRGRARPIGCAAVRWVRPDELDSYAFPRANRRVIELLAGKAKRAMRDRRTERKSREEARRRP